MDLKGKIVLVVGGAGGIGLGIGKAFAAEGCKVALADTDEDGLAKATETASSDSAFVWRTCDITDRGQVSKLFQWLGDELGPVDILVNSAGINVANRMMSNIDPADFDRMMEINTTGTFNCIHAALAGMRQKGEGLIVNIVSLAGKHVMPLAGLPYCVNIYPGETNTPIIDKRPTPPPPEKRAQMLQPEDIASCVVTIAKLPARAVVPELVITPPHMMLG